MLFRTVSSPSPYGLPFPNIGVRNPKPKLQSLLSQERVKLRTSHLAGTMLAGTFTGPSEQKPIKNFGEKGARAYPGTAQYPLLSQEWVNLRTSNFVRTFIGSIGTKTH